MVQVLKIYVPSRSGLPEIRRLTINSNVLSSHAILVEKIIVAIPSLTGKCFELCWKDIEGDDVLISNDNDLAQAVANLDDDLLKIYVRFIGSDVINSSKKSTAFNEIHPGVQCDGCSEKVVGFRYKCLQCHDFDLCNECNFSGKHAFHDMVKLVAPSDLPRQWSFVGWRRFFKSMFGFEPITATIDQSEMKNKMKCPYFKFHAPKSENTSSDEEVKESKSPESSPKAEPKKTDFHQGSHAFPPFMHPGAFMGHGFPGTNDNGAFHNLIADNAGPVCDFINGFLKPLGADLRIEVDDLITAPKAEKNGKSGEESKNQSTECEAKTENEKSTPADSGIVTENAKQTSEENTDSVSSESSGARPKSKSPSIEKQIPGMSRGLFAHTMCDSGFSAAEVVNMATSTVNETSGDVSSNKSEPLIDLNVQDANGSAEGWTVINAPPTKCDKSVETPVKIESTEVKYPVLDGSTKVEPHQIPQPTAEEDEDLSKLDPEVANALIKMRAMGFTNEGGWLLRLLQAKRGNIYQALDSLYPNQPQYR